MHRKISFRDEDSIGCNRRFYDYHPHLPHDLAAGGSSRR